MELMPDFRRLAAEWVAEYRRRGATIEGPSVAWWIDRVGQLFRESWAARQVEIHAADQLGAIIDTLDRAMDRVKDATD